MAPGALPDSLAGQARRLYTEQLVKGLVHVVQAAMDGARVLLDKPSEHGTVAGLGWFGWRWSRWMSPYGTFHVPKRPVSLSAAAMSASNRAGISFWYSLLSTSTG